MKTALVLTFLVLTGFHDAIAQRSFDQPNSKTITIARENVRETTKGFCIDYWTRDPAKVRKLSPFASVSEMCSCIENELSYTISDELAERLIQFQLDANSNNIDKYLDSESTIKTSKDYMNIYSAASVGCGEKFMARRR